MRSLSICTIVTSILLGLTIKSSAQFVAMSSRQSEFKPPETLQTPDGGYIGISKRETRVRGTGWNVARYILSLTKYDSQLRKVKEVMIADGEPAYTLFYAALKKSGDKLWLIYVEPAKGSNFGNIKAAIINSTTLATEDIKTLATEEQVKLKVSGITKLKIYVESSGDARNHCLFINTGDNEFYLSGFDESFQSLWSARQTVPGYKPEDMNAISINNTGEVFMTSIKNELSTISVYSKQGKAEHKKLSFGTIQPTDVKIYETDVKEKLLVTGLYTGNTENVTGVYRAILNRKTDAIENLINSDFPDLMIERLKKDGFASKRSKSFGIEKDVLSFEIFKRSNGDLVQVLECKHFLGADGMSGTGIGSLITASFTSTGIVFSHIPRYSVVPMITRNNEYFVSTCKNDFILFYKDAASNLDKNLDQPQTVLNGDKNAVLVAAYVGDDGKISKRVKVSSQVAQATENINIYLTNQCKVP